MINSFFKIKLEDICPECKSDKIYSCGEESTTIGFLEKDMNHKRTGKECITCKFCFCVESCGDNYWITKNICEVIAGIPTCCIESYKNKV